MQTIQNTQNGNEFLDQTGCEELVIEAWNEIVREEYTNTFIHVDHMNHTVQFIICETLAEVYNQSRDIVDNGIAQFTCVALSGINEEYLRNWVKVTYKTFYGF
jgi:hypothetical protein